jgi:hypothetical protein
MSISSSQVAASRKPLLAAEPGDELRTLLDPITPEAFVGEYWAKRPLFVKGFRAKYHGFFDGEAFSRALATPHPNPDFLRASFDRKTDEGTSAGPRDPGDLRSTAFRATVEQAVPLFDAGATLCVSQIESRVPSLAPFLAAVKRQLGFPGKVAFNAYLSPAHSGYNWHFDSRIASTLQIEGTKTWRFSKHVALPWPRGNGSLDSDGLPRYAEPGVAIAPWERLAPFDETDVDEVTLEPGDLLVLPAGLWHEACGGTSGSLALNLSFSPVSYTHLVRKLLDDALLPNGSWRSTVPALPGSEPGSVDPAAIAAIAAELRRAADYLGSLAGDSAAVVKLWQAFVQNPNPTVPVAPASPAPAVATVGPNERLRVAPDVHAMAADGGTLLCLAIGSARSLEVAGAAAAFVRRMLREREFVAGACMTWSDDGGAFAWDDVASLLTSFKREGALAEVR